MSGGGGDVTTGYQPSGQPAADLNYQAITQGGTPWATALPGQTIPQYQQILQGMLNNPYGAGAQQNANQTSAYGMGTVAPQMFDMSRSLQGMGDMAGPYAQQILQAGFDPQGDVYAREFQKMQDAANATNSAYGVASSPYGAGLAMDAGRNFNTDWQQNALNRMTTSSYGYGALTGAAGNAYQGAADLGNMGLQTRTNAGNLPFMTSQAIGMGGFDALDRMNSGVMGSLLPGHMLSGDLANYLNIGQSATALKQNAQEQEWQRDAAMWSGIGQLFGQGAQAAAMMYGS